MQDHRGEHDDETHLSSFDEKAATWDDDPAKLERARVVAAAVRSATRPDGSERLLEHGAGTGLLSEALQADIASVTMADTSAGMRQVMHDKVASGVIPSGRVWDVDLGAAVGLPDEKFDLVVTMLALHHVEDIDRTLHNFADLIEPGGHLCIAELDHEDGSFHGEGFGGHHGFVRDDLEAQIRSAGFTDVVFQSCHYVEKNGRDYPMFLATATR